MADTKISDLTALTAPALLDVSPVVDVSDTTQAASGTTKKLTIQDLMIGAASLGTDLADALDGDSLLVYNSSVPSQAYKISFANLQNLPSAAGTPASASANRVKQFASNMGGRPMLSSIGPSGRPVVLQPSFMSSAVQMILPSVTTALTTVGCAATSVGTISHPAVTQTTGYMANQVTAGTANATAGTGSNVATFYRGDGTGFAAGFHFAARIYMPDASYDETGVASTGSRIFAGLTAGTLAAAVASDNPAGDIAGFARNSVNAGLTHANWQIVTKDNVTVNFTDTGLAFAAQQVFDLFLYQPRAGGTLYWRVDNITTSQTASGSVSTSLPTAATAMRFGVQVQSVNAVARNIRHQHVYCESDL